MKSIVCIIEPCSSERDRLKEILISMCDQVKTFDSAEVVAAKRIGRETVQYVSNIYKYYVAYRSIADRLKLRGDARTC